MKFNKSLKYCTILIGALSLLQLINCTRTYWPPIAHKMHLIDLENSLTQQLEEGCTKKEYKLESNQEPEHFFVVSHTSTFGYGKPVPTQFTHIATGEQIDLNTTCVDCRANEFNFDGTTYKTTNFDCRNLCIFNAQRIDGDCMIRRNKFKISLPFDHKHLELYKSCYRSGNFEEQKMSSKQPETYLDYIRENAHNFLGMYSKKIWFHKSEKENCPRKCLPICRLPISGVDTDTDADFQSYDKTEAVIPKLMDEDEKFDVKLYTTTFMKNLCSYDRPNNTLYQSLRLKDFQCNSSGKYFGSIMIVFFSYIFLKLF